MAGYSRLILVLVITTLPKTGTIKQGDGPAPLVRKRREQMCLATRSLHGAWILTSFPL